MPGAISPATAWSRTPIRPASSGHRFDRDLEAALGRTVRLANVCRLLRLSERPTAPPPAARSVFGVILGTGVGGGIVIAGTLLAGANAIAGEWGHKPPALAGRFRASRSALLLRQIGLHRELPVRPGLAADHRRITGSERGCRGDHPRGGAWRRGGAGQPRARYVDRLARGLASVINIIDPEFIVLGGGLSRIAMLY